jgi:hypothetical protein
MASVTLMVEVATLVAAMAALLMLWIMWLDHHRGVSGGSPPEDEEARLILRRMAMWREIREGLEARAGEFTHEPSSLMRANAQIAHIRENEQQMLFEVSQRRPAFWNSRQTRVPHWALALMRRNDARRYGCEWSAHLHQLIEEGETRQARRDRRRLALAAITLAVALRIRQALGRTR